MISKKVKKTLIDFLSSPPEVTSSGKMVHPVAPHGYMYTDNEILKLADNLDRLPEQIDRKMAFMLSLAKTPHGLIGLLDEAYRLPLALELMWCVPKKEAAKCFREGYTGGYTGHVDTEELVDLFSYTADDIMYKREKETLMSLPERVTVYRGCTDDMMMRPSWSLDRDIADGFARRSNGHLYRAVIEKRKILALIDEREEEIIVDPNELSGVRVVSA